MKHIEYSFLKKIDEEYQQDKTNKIIENAIKNVGIQKVCLNHDVMNTFYDIFNIELPKSKIYNQVESQRCWIHAGVNLIKNNVAKNLNVDPNEYALSINYLAFLDKLEKANALYNQVIEKDDFNFDQEIHESYLKMGVYEEGYYSFFKALVKKYGIVPESVMPDVESSKRSEELTKIFREKVKKDVFKLLKEKKQSKEKLYELKANMVKENYHILAKCLGELPFTFDYEYKDRSGKCIKLSQITPLEFSRQYLTMDLDNFISVVHLPMYNKEYYKLYRKKYNENIFDHSYVEWINMPVHILKDLAIKQLKDGVPVCVGMEVRKMRERQMGIMDAKLYNYQEVFGFEPLTKEEALSMYEIRYQHCMLITGVHLEQDKPVRWKIEDSYGDDIHKNGYYIMNDNYFDEFVFEVLIDQKYLSTEQLEILKQEPILVDMDEPF
ncbi:MAG TPA: hypothetical protein IAB56_04295 [Candidatus Scybalousia intestinigallinarum]|nr:hypothetical protein [Candidatus Scybalousia intestinigallinarum]